jgi:methylisocitrate lyase
MRVANKAMEDLYATIRGTGGTMAMLDRMQTRAELYATIGYHDYEALDASLTKTVIPKGCRRTEIRNGGDHFAAAERSLSNS